MSQLELSSTVRQEEYYHEFYGLKLIPMAVCRYMLLCWIFLNWNLPANSQELIFPDDYIGKWSGNLEIYDVNGISQTLEMELIISKSHHIDTFYFTLKYRNDQIIENRNYLIIKDQHNPGLLKIDEQNGIILDIQQFRNKWISAFRINDSVVHFHLNLFEHQLVVEIFSVSHNDIRMTGGRDEIPSIGILKNTFYQYATLYNK